MVAPDSSGTIIACKDTNFYYRRFTMRRSFILMLVLSCAFVSCGTAGQYADNYRYQDGIYYRGVPAGEEVALADNESGKQFNDKIKVQYDEYGWSSAKTYSSIILVPTVGWPYGYSSWYWGNPWYYGSSWYYYQDPWYYGSPWYWDSWYWNDWYYRPYWHYDHYYYHHHYHPHYYGHYKSTTHTPHAGVSMRQSPNSTRVRTSSATRSSSSASYNNGRSSSTYRRTPSATNGSSSSYRSTTPSRSSSSSSFNSGSSRGSSFNSSGSSSSRSSGGSYRSSGGGSSHSGGGVSRGRR